MREKNINSVCSFNKNTKMKKSNRKVNIWEEEVILPTYEIGKSEKNPMFFEKRVYQGSSGVVYPYPVIEKFRIRVWTRLIMQCGWKMNMSKS